MSGFLIESALLTHGLAGVSNSKIKDIWKDGWKIAWIETGRLVTGEADAFCAFRDRADSFRRINYFSYDDACRGKWSGPLTASGTIRACEETGCRLAVTCGIGGLVFPQTADRSNDIAAMKTSDVSLAATAFKDMFDAEYSIRTALQEGINVCRLTGCWHRGYIFCDDGEAETVPAESNVFCPKTLYLAPVPPERLVRDRSVLEKAVVYGKEEAAKGKAFHPAVNRRIDELTGGYSSEIQLMSLADNILRAELLVRRAGESLQLNSTQQKRRENGNE